MRERRRDPAGSVLSGCKPPAALFLLLLLPEAGCLRGVRLTAPQATLAGAHVTLACEYDLEGAPLYSVRWYRDMTEFYRYVPKESPAARVFPLPDMHVDTARSDATHVTLRDVKRSGLYQCEVSADAPLFHTDIQAVEMTVAEAPTSGPVVWADRRVYGGGDHIKAECAAPPASPPANITWFVNEQPVWGSTQRGGWNGSEIAGSSSLLQLQAASSSPDAPAPPLLIRCEAWLFDVWRSSSENIVVQGRGASPAAALGRSYSGGGVCGLTCPARLLVLVATSRLLLSRLHIS